MRSNALVRVLGFPAMLTHGDTLVLDRFLWLRKRLPEPQYGHRLLDAGCGSGAFTVWADRVGYDALGLTWDEDDAQVARERAALVKSQASFEVQDLRQLASRDDLDGRFDTVLCFENIEHILNDEQLMRSLVGTLRPGGVLLLTTPNADYWPLDRFDAGPWTQVEDGGHVRKGYTEERLRELSELAGLRVEALESCSGILSQKVTALHRALGRLFPPLLAWAIIAPLRVLPPLLDPLLAAFTKRPDYCLCIAATKPSV